MEVLAGGLAASAACLFTNPLEVVKNRLQLQGELKARQEYKVTYRGPVHGLYVMAKSDGLGALQSGLLPALMYQLVMNGLRLGIFAEFENRGFTRGKDGNIDPWRSVACGAVAGTLGGLVGSPIFLVKTQLQTSSLSSQIAVGHQHNHGSMVQGFRNIYQTGGIVGLFQGATASIPRISVGSAAQLATYSLAQQKINESPLFKSLPAWKSNMAAAFLSGFVVVVCMNPLDVISTRLYNQPAENRFYTSYLDCVRKITMTEGPLAFYKGMVAQYLRIGPHSFLTLVFWHHIRNWAGISRG